MKYPQLVSMPSAVSDWLEEQLEARGIDAVVYTRYILSLLHSHPVDVIYPDDLQFSLLKKEVRRQGISRKRFRGSSSDWWRHAQAEAEQIKRSAAVECLMSASDQNCEIESLVDELCEKLKEVKSSPASPLLTSNENASSASPATLKFSPQELAEKYYAAFPPLKTQSPEEKAQVSVVPKWRQTASPIKKKGQRKQGVGRAGQARGYSEQKLHFKVDNETMKARSQNKQRFSYLTRNKNTPPHKNDWDFNMFTNKIKTPKQAVESPVKESDQCVADIWANDDDMNMYDDLPVDIQLLLDSPSPHDDSVEMMNMANMRDDGKRAFIPYGTNIISSIWSTDHDVTYDNCFNAALDADSSLDFKFSSISIDKPSSEHWPAFDGSAASENEVNSFFENNSRCKRSLFLDGFRSLPGDWKKVEEYEKEREEKMLKHLALSLMKLNHNKEKSCFREIVPRSSSLCQEESFNPFSRANSMFNFNLRHNLNFDREKEDLLTSERSHFKPITEKVDQRVQGQYADGATFVISNNLEKVDYKRSESGSMWLDTGLGHSQKYLKYKVENSDSHASPELEFVLKFSICQNDKACQTEDKLEEDLASTEFQSIDTVGHVTDPSPPSTPPELVCSCLTAVTSPDGCSSCLYHRASAPMRPDSVLGELLWKYEVKTCEKCHNNNMQWNVDWSLTPKVRSEWDSENLRNIWNSGEICQTCLNLQNADSATVPCTPPSVQNRQLREDISQDGEQLLSDLTNLQKCYMEEQPPLVTAEFGCDTNELVTKERKRRHSFMFGEQSGTETAEPLRSVEGRRRPRRRPYSKGYPYPLTHADI